MSVISIEQYQILRDRLAAILECAVNLPDLHRKSEEQIKLARHKLLENQFELVLVGEFQGGKSTTFNVLTGGREISPRGKNFGGLKTSGCIIRATHIADPDEEEHANVTWRKNNELLMGFEKLLTDDLSHFSDTHNQENSDRDEHQTPSEDPRFDLNTKSGRDAIWKRAQEALGRWKEDPSSFPTGEVDMIRFALLTVYFFENPSLQELRVRNRFALDEIKGMSTFPLDWDVRWSDWSPEAFQFEEITVAFVAEIDLRIHCERLGRLGAAVVDCPGMFASPWDTRVSEGAILSADAVFYLIRGDQTLTLSSLNQLHAIRMNPNRIFLAPNVKNVAWGQAERIARATSAVLQKEGIAMPEDRVRPYNGLLALHGRQMEIGLDHLDARSISELCLDFKRESESIPPPASSIPTRMTSRVKKLIASLEEIDESSDVPTENLAQRSISVSRVTPLLDAVERFVLETKARATLEGNAERAEQALNETEGSLRYKEDAAKKKLEECEQEFQEADSRLKEFEEEAQHKLSQFGGNAAEALGKSLTEHLLSGRDQCVKEISDSLAPEIKKILGSFEWAPKTVVKKIEKKVQEVFNDWTKNRISSWVGEITRGDNVAYNEVIKRPLAILISDINRFWNRVNRDKPLSILQNIELPTNHHMDAFHVFPVNSMIKAVLDEIQKQQRAMRFGVILFGLTIILAAVVLLTAVTWPVMLALIPIFALLWPDFKDFIWSKDALEKKLQPKFQELSGRFGEAAKLAVNEYIAKAKEMIDQKIINHPREVFKSLSEETRDKFNVAEGERLRLGEIARVIRETKVAPLQDELNAFLEEIRKIWS